MKYAAIAALFLSGCALQPHEMAQMSKYQICDISITSFGTPRSFSAKRYAAENGIDCSDQRAYFDAQRYQATQGLAVSAAIMNQARPPQPVIYMNPFPPPEPQTIIIQQPVRPYRFIDSSPYRYR